MDDTIRRLVVEPLGSFMERVFTFLPNVLLALAVLAAGLAVSGIVRFALHKLLAAVGLDRHAEKSGVLDLFRRGGIKLSFSDLIARLVFWLMAIMFTIISLKNLELPQVDRLLSEFFLYLPNVFTAVAVMFIGYILSNFLAKAALVSAVNAGIRMSGLLGKAVKLVVMLLAVTMALEQLGIGRGTILIVFSIAFGGVVLALAIAFGLGSKDLAKEFMEKHLTEKEKEEKDEISHL